MDFVGLNLVKAIPPSVPDSEEVEQLTEEMYNFIRDHHLPPVVARDIYPESKQQLWENLEIVPMIPATSKEEFFVLGSSSKTNYILRPNLTPRGDDQSLDTQYLVIVSGEMSYPLRDRLTDYYQEEHRLEAYNTLRSVEGISASPNQMWKDHPQILRRWLRAAILRYLPKHPHAPINFEDANFKTEILQSMFDDRIHVSQYRITWVISIIEYFRQYIHIQKMLDPSMGWGDRLLGAIKLGLEYHGFDPNTALHPGYQRMISDFSADPSKYERSSQGLRTSKYLLEAKGFELADLKELVDLVLTSPPYGDIEVYSNQSTQSIKKYRKNWFTGFYEPYILKAWEAIRPGGIMILQIGDNQKFKMVNKSIQFFKTIDDVIPWGQFFTYSNLGKYPNLHLVYRKRGRGPEDRL